MAKTARLAVLAFLVILSQLAYADLRDQIVEHIYKATSSIDLVVYEIRSNDIVNALIDAHQRAVHIRIIVDSVHSPTATPQEKMLDDDNIPIKRVGGLSRDLLHDKFILFDGSIASTPSYNRSAKSLRGKGNENAGFMADHELITQLNEQFENVWNHAPTFEHE